MRQCKKDEYVYEQSCARTFSSFGSGNHPAEETQPERFYHGFVFGMVVNLADRYKVHSNRESGYGRYDVMMELLDKAGKAFIFEFKVMDADDDEETLEDTVDSGNDDTMISDLLWYCD